MLIKKQHNKNIIFLEKLNKVKQECCLKTQTLNKSLCCTNPTTITPKKKLTITLQSYAICQAKDISSSIVAIEKLINYLNYLCAKQLHDYSKLCPLPWSTISDTTGTIKEFKPIILGLFTSSHTNVLPKHSIAYAMEQAILSRYQKQQGYNKTINCNNSDSLKKVLKQNKLTNYLKQNNFAEDHSSYVCRCFFKLSKKFSSLSAINKKIVQRRNSKKLLTLIRAPFVFKKTREQFSLQKLSSHIVITFVNSAQKHFIIQNLRLLKLPTELKVVSHN